MGWRCLAVALALAGLAAADGSAPRIAVVATPGGGVQPQVAVGRDGVVHLVYLRGDPKAADVFYTRWDPQTRRFATPTRVNRRPGAAVAMGTIRGAQISLGKDDRVHIVWNGSSRAQPRGTLNPAQPADSPYNGAPLLYTRNRPGGGFEPARNLMGRTFGLDGGGSVAADGRGNVYVAWHAQSSGAPKGEAGRRVWLARSSDGGKTFSTAAAVNPRGTGACGCCSLRLFADGKGRLYLLYRAARQGVNRDMMLLTSQDSGRTFRSARVQAWRINSCPMSSMSAWEAKGGVLTAWETQGQVYFGLVDGTTLQPPRPLPAPGTGRNRKHPALAADASGTTLLAWTEGTGWRRGGDLVYQLLRGDGRPAGEARRVRGGVSVWGMPAVAALRGGGFLVVR